MKALSVINDRLGMGGLKLKKASPEILVVGGIIGVVAATVMACRATLKADEIIENSKKELEKIKDLSETDPAELSEEYTEEMRKKDTFGVYCKAAVGFAKTYALPVAIGTASVCSILGSHKIMKQRNIALAAAYGVLDKGFRTYRGRVREELGEKLDHHFLHGSEDVTIEEKITDEETGKQKKVKHKGISVSTDYELYARWFDKTCKQWEPNKDYNLLFLKRAEEYFNMRLKSVGYVFLNEVYDYLGIERTPEGQCVGWMRGYGDDYIDFRIWNNAFADVEDRGGYYVVRKLPNEECVRDADIFLDFNVYGPIIENM